MSEPDGVLVARGTLARVPGAANGWRASESVLALIPLNDTSAVLINVARSSPVELARRALERLGLSLPAERAAAFHETACVVSSGRNGYLVVKKGDAGGTLVPALAAAAPEFATIVDQSDQLAFFALEGAAGSRVLSALCSVDFSPHAFPECAAIVTRMHDMRAYIWREPPTARYVIGVQRSLAPHAWEVLLEACETHSSSP